MKVVKAELTAKILITAMIVILVGVFIIWMTGTFNDKKEGISFAAGKIKSETNSLSDFDILVYEGDTIGGKALIELMYELYERINDRSLQLIVCLDTLGEDKKEIIYPYNPKPMASLSPVAKFYYSYLDNINPTGIFKGEIGRTRNDEIVSLTFTQQK